MKNKKIYLAWRDIESSMIKSIYYSCNGQKEYLGIKFTNEYSYVYSDVPLNIIFQMIMADSCGGYFSKHIRSKYPYKHIGKINHDSPLIDLGITEDGKWNNI